MPLSVNSGTGLVPQASNLTTEQVLRSLVAPLAATSIFLNSGVQIIDSASPVRFPLAPDVDDDYKFVAEGASIPETNPDFDEVTLLPTTMQSLKIITRYTNELLRQSVVAIDAALQTNLVTSVAATLDNALISGSGDGVTQPKSLLNYSGTQTLAVSGAISIDALYDAELKLQMANVPTAGAAWWFHPNTWNALRKLKASGTGNYLVQPDVTAQSGASLLGHPVTVTPHLPVHTAGSGETHDTVTGLLWNPSYTRAVRDVNAQVTILPELYAATDEVGIRVVTRYDAGTVKPESIVKLTGIYAS